MKLLAYDDRLHLPQHLRKPLSNSDRRSEYVLETLRRIQTGEKSQTFASWTIALGDDGLALFNTRPSSQWWVRDYDLEPILSYWGLRALDGFVACGAGAPAQTVPVARHIESPKIAPMMAEALGRLTKQRALAETWLMSYPRAAAIGLVPPAVGKQKKPRTFALGALEYLVRCGHGALVRQVADEYGVGDQLAEVLAVEVAVPAKRTIDLDERIRELEAHLLHANSSPEAYRLVDELCGMDSDRALFAVVEISRRARSKPIRRRTAQSLDAVRARRGLSPGELEDRMLPTLGLGEDVVEIGGVAYRLAASTALERQLVGPGGKRVSRLPRSASDDAKAKWSLLGKELRTVSRAVIGRLELRMITGEPWSTSVFCEHLVGHPLLRELARGLLWRSGNLLFRVAEDYTFAGVNEDEATLSDEPVTIVHPLDLASDEIATWSEVFANNEVAQPFDQLGRWHGTSEVENGKLVGWTNRVVSPFGLLALERRGWQRSRFQAGALLELTSNLGTAPSERNKA